MIKGILIFNQSGEARVTKFYESVGYETEQQDVLRRVYQLVGQRHDNWCNYLEAEGLPGWGDGTKLIYRHYATLYFVFCVDTNESDLGILDLIQVLVEALDRVFENVCELDLIFHSDRVHYVIDEIIVGGIVIETNITAIMKSLNEQDALAKTSLSAATQRTVIGGFGR